MIDSDLIALRRTLHQYPELSNHEAETAARVIEALRPLGLPIRDGIAGHGLLVDIEGAHPGPTLAYRADMDALPIQEEGPADYCSRNPGVMHACGHDVHTTIAVGVAHALAARRAELHGRVRIIFQPAEEAAAPPGQVIGAEAMARAGAVDGIDGIFALHCMPGLEVGRIGYCEQAVWAASDLFWIRLFGATAHGAYPHQGIDAVQMAAATVSGLLAIPNRVADALSPCVVTVGRIQAGTAHNIIAGRAELDGIVRTVEESTRARVLEALHRIVEHTAAAFGGHHEIDTTLSAPAVRNDPRLQSRAVSWLAQHMGTEVVQPHRPQMGAEDFASFSNRVPGCYLLLGVRNETRGIIHDIHTPKFDVDEACIPLAVTHMSGLIAHLGARWEATP